MRRRRLRGRRLRRRRFRSSRRKLARSSNSVVRVGSIGFSLTTSILLEGRSNDLRTALGVNSVRTNGTKDHLEIGVTLVVGDQVTVAHDHSGSISSDGENVLRSAIIDYRSEPVVGVSGSQDMTCFVTEAHHGPKVIIFVDRYMKSVEVPANCANVSHAGASRALEENGSSDFRTGGIGLQIICQSGQIRSDLIVIKMVIDAADEPSHTDVTLVDDVGDGDGVLDPRGGLCLVSIKLVGEEIVRGLDQEGNGKHSLGTSNTSIDLLGNSLHSIVAQTLSRDNLGSSLGVESHVVGMNVLSTVILQDQTVFLVVEEAVGKASSPEDKTFGSYVVFVESRKAHHEHRVVIFR